MRYFLTILILGALLISITGGRGYVVQSHIKKVSYGGSGSSIVIQPYDELNVDPRGRDYELEALGYSDGIYWPGSSYGPAFFGKTDMTGVDTIFIKSANWRHLSFYGIKGTSGHHIKILVQGDAIVTFTWGLTFTDCEYLDIEGIPLGVTAPNRYPTAAEADSFRIQIHCPNTDRAIGLEIIGRTKYITISGVKGKTLFYGAQIKTDPFCDTRYDNGAWIIDHISLTHFWFEDVSADVIYDGNSSNMLKGDDPTNGRDITCSGTTYADSAHLPMKSGNGTIAYGVIMRAGRQAVVCGGQWWGITLIHDLYIRHTGYELNQGQGEGIGLGGMCRNVFIYNCDIKFTFLYGIADFGNSTNYIFNNRIDSTGYLDASQAFDIPDPYSYFLRAGTDLDSLCSTYFISGYVLSHSGNIVENNNAGGVYNISSTTKVYYPTTETKTTQFINNRLGANSRNVAGIIAFENFGPAENWTRATLLCSNTLLDGATAATIQKFTYNPGSGAQDWPETTTDCPDFHRKTIPAGSTIQRYHH
jgi:hypothetical protein